MGAKMDELKSENFRHACESSDQEAQLFAFWMHSSQGMAAARVGDEETIDKCQSALAVMASFFAGTPVAEKAAASIDQMDKILIRHLYGSAAERQADGASG